MFISSKELSSYKKIGNDHFHIESNLYLNDGIVYKKIITDDWLDEKKNIINYFMDKQFKETVNPIDNLYVDNKFSGYVMPYFDGFTIKNLSNSDIRVKLKILKLCSLYLRNLHHEGIVVGDLSDYNIMYNINEVKFIDTDSYGYLDNKPIIMPRILLRNKYIDEKYINTVFSDVYLLNLLVIQVLYDIDVSKTGKMIGKDINKLLESKSVPSSLINLNDIFDREELRYPDSYLDEIKIANKR